MENINECCFIIAPNPCDDIIVKAIIKLVKIIIGW